MTSHDRDVNDLLVPIRNVAILCARRTLIGSTVDRSAISIRRAQRGRGALVAASALEAVTGFHRLEDHKEMPQLVVALRTRSRLESSRRQRRSDIRRASRR